MFVDAVHFALHGSIDVRDIGCDFLALLGLQVLRPARRAASTCAASDGARVDPLKLRAQEDDPPYRFETGTLNHEGIAGAGEAVEFIADLGAPSRRDDRPRRPDRPAPGRRRRHAGHRGLRAAAGGAPHRRARALPGVTHLRAAGGHPRTSTVSFTVDGIQRRRGGRALGAQGLFVWDGDFYATRLVEKLGLLRPRRPGARRPRPVQHGRRGRARRRRRRRPPDGAMTGARPAQAPTAPVAGDPRAGPPTDRATHRQALPAGLRQRRPRVLRAARRAGARARRATGCASW